MVTPDSEGVGRLLVHPKPLRGESLHGFVLRVADANGIQDELSWGWRASICGRALSAEKALQNVSSLTGVRVDELQGLAHLFLTSHGTDTCEWMGHNLRRSVFRIHPSICPQCLEDNPATRGIWDLRLITACTRHRSWLVDTCSSCLAPLSWRRKGVFTCSCGADLTREQRNTPVPDEILAVTSFVEQQIMRDLPEAQSEIRLPAWLRDVEMGVVLHFLNSGIRKLAATFELPLEWKGIGSKRLAGDIHVASIASRFLSAWPSGLYAIMRGDAKVDRRTKRMRWNCLAEAFIGFADIHRAIVRGGWSLNRIMEDGSHYFQTTDMTPAEKRANVFLVQHTLYLSYRLELAGRSIGMPS
ncbi:TniQ family protein [Uliginosibacterium flavum]|uniref:TniQ family protein n=1 Tax=Uliginosibacterium flavum TaxID=1396831 RepID=A0ABV2TLI6_9RHOO